jgi:ribosomal protein L3 glutamine methyltransferase
MAAKRLAQSFPELFASAVETMARALPEPPIDDLISVRDWLRYGASLFNKANLVYGHGTANAVDEAAFLMLSTLHLPIDEIEPWLECRLSRDERMAVAAIFAARVTSRKPASYLTHSAWIQGHKFYCDERVIIPRSFIGELLARDGLSSVVGNGTGITRVLDLCTGSGCLAILAALAFPRAEVDASDISGDALEVARRNISTYGLERRIKLHQSDLFETLAAQKYDLVIANPPYVTTDAVESFPPEYRAEPRIAHIGGSDGLDFVRRILSAASSFLAPGGSLVVEIGQGRADLEATGPNLPYLWLDTETSEGEVFALSAGDFIKQRKPVDPAPRKPAKTAKSRKPASA